MRTARRTVETLTLPLIAYGKAESMTLAPAAQYGELRDRWGMFLDTLMTKVKDVLWVSAERTNPQRHRVTSPNARLPTASASGL